MAEFKTASRAASRKIIKNKILFKTEEKVGDNNFKFLKDLSEIKSDENNFIEKDEQIQKLNKEIQVLNSVINKELIEELGLGTDRVSTKILKLYKRNRHLCSEIKTLKSNQIKLVEQISYMEDAAGNKSNEKKSEELKNPPTTPRELEVLHKELTLLKTKLNETINQNGQLRHNLETAHRCLKQEVGGNVNISDLTASGSAWKGRSQLIATLQNKVSELTQKLTDYSTDSNEYASTKEFRKIEMQRRNEHEDLLKETNSLKETANDQKYKLTALKTRNKILNDEITNIKIKLNNLLEKSDHDDQLIKKMDEELELQSIEYENKFKDFELKIKELRKLNKEMEDEKSKYLLKIENYVKDLEDKNKRIHELNEDKRRLEVDLRLISGDFLFSCRDFKKDEFIKLVNQFEEEKRLLLKQIKTFNKRNDDDKEKKSLLHDRFQQLKIRYLRLEAKLREYEDEQHFQKLRKQRTDRVKDYSRSLCSISSGISQVSSVSSLSQTAQYDILKLEELKNKLELSNERIMFLENNLHELKNEKTLDIKMYTEIILKSKNLMVESLKNELVEKKEMDDSKATIN